MPSDANGVHSLPTGYLAEEGDTIQPSQHNPPLEDVSNGLTERLMRSGVAPMTGPLKLVDGSSLLPAITFNSDTTVGFYRDGNFIAASRPIKGVLPVGLGPLPWSRATAPPGWVLCYGQTLNRVTYADLWTVAQAEIAAGNTLFNNGDGSMTFGIMDMRGRVTAGLDNMGGVTANRLTPAMSSNTMGGTGGNPNTTLSQGNLPFVAYPLNGSPATISVGSNRDDIAVIPGGWGTTGLNNGIFPFATVAAGNGFVVPITSSGGYTPSGSIGPLGNSGAFNIIQPTIIANFILYTGA